MISPPDRGNGNSVHHIIHAMVAQSITLQDVRMALTTPPPDRDAVLTIPVKKHPAHRRCLGYSSTSSAHGTSPFFL